MISGTVSDFNNETLILLETVYGDSIRLLHNAHDGDKVAIKRDKIKEGGIAGLKYNLKAVIERPITYQNRTLTLTAGIKIYE